MDAVKIQVQPTDRWIVTDMFRLIDINPLGSGQGAGPHQKFSGNFNNTCFSQCHRKLGQCKQAETYFRAFQERSSDDHMNDMIQRHIDDCPNANAADAAAR